VGRAALQISSQTFPAGELLAGLEWAGRAGVSGVEFGPASTRQLHASADARRKVLGRLGGSGFRQWSLHASAEVEGLEADCALARELGAGLIVVHCPHQKLLGAFDEQVRALRRWDDWCRQRGVILTVENASIQPLEPFVSLFQAVPELRLTLDVKHAYKPERLGLTHADYLGCLGGRVANFHVSGIDRARDHLGDGVPPGRDAVDWDELAAELAGRRYAGLITAEVCLPEDLGAAELERAYGELAAPAAGARTLGERLARHSLDFFGRKFAAVLGV